MQMLPNITGAGATRWFEEYDPDARYTDVPSFEAAFVTVCQAL